MDPLLYLSHESYARRLKTIDECVMFTVNLLFANDDEETREQAFQFYKRCALNTYHNAYVDYLKSCNM